MPLHESIPVTSYLSGSDAVKLLEFIHGSLSCATEEKFADLFPKIQELFPFKYATALMGRMDNNGMIVASGANISFPEQWLHEYQSKNYLQADAVLKENFTKYQVQHWSVDRRKLHRRADINSLCYDFGMRECFTHGSRPAAGEQNGSMFAFAGPSMKFEMRTVAILEFIIPHLHLAFSHIFGRERMKDDAAVLSSREKEVLNWLKQGKSSWDMSVILGISERTVNYHVYNIIQKLGVTNRTQAVAVATRQGLVDIG